MEEEPVERDTTSLLEKRPLHGSLHFFRTRMTRRMAVGLVVSVLVLLGITGVVLVAVLPENRAKSTFSRSHVVLLLGDGFGPASVALARAYLNHTGIRDRLHLDARLVGAAQTASLDSRVTDSAAGATAWTCGMRTFNGRVAALDDGSACGTVMEAAKRVGKKVGLVVKSRVTDASPACFSAHSVLRDRQQFIAHQQIRQGFDVILGGGRDTYSFRYGGEKSALDYAREDAGYQYVETREQLLQVQKLPLLGLFSSGNMKYDIDRLPEGRESEPTLLQMTQKALDLLIEADLEGNGILLFVEGSLIDKASHYNDAATMVRDAAGFDDVFGFLAEEWIRQHPDATVLSMADHATGGLTLGINYPGPSYPDPYAFYLDHLAAAEQSVQSLAHNIIQDNVYPFTTLINMTLGFRLTTEQAATLRTWQQAKDEDRFARELSEMISTSDLIGWSTWGHDAVDINVYCAGQCDPNLWTGSNRNDILGQRLTHRLGLEAVQNAITANLTGFNTTGHDDGWPGGDEPFQTVRWRPGD